MGIIRLVLVLAVLLAGATAHAGALCATDEDGHDDPKVELRQLEELAAGKPPKDLFYIYCLERATKFKARIMAACRKIVDQKDWTTGCLVVAASLQEPKLGKHDVFDWIAHLERDPWEVNPSLPDYPLYLFEMLGDCGSRTIRRSASTSLTCSPKSGTTSRRTSRTSRRPRPASRPSSENAPQPRRTSRTSRRPRRVWPAVAGGGRR